MTKRLNLLHLAGVTLFAFLVAAFCRFQFHSEWLELAGYVTGIVAVYLVSVEHIINWPIGIANVLIYAVFFYQGKFYADASLQIFFFVLSVHGWYQWARGGTDHSELQITRMEPRKWLWALAAFLIGCAIYIPILVHKEGASPYFDGPLAVASMIAQVMLNRKLFENWLVWIAVDIVYFPLYLSKGWQATALLDLVLLGLAVSGYVQWRRTLRMRAATSVV